MIEITSYKGVKKKLLKEFESEQWPISDFEHYGNDAPEFKKEKFTFVAFEDARIVGFIIVTIDTGVANIDALLVHDKSRRKGIGNLLLQKAEVTAKDKGCHVVKLETGEDWNARKLYEKRGYLFRASLKEYYGKRDFILMDKKI
jgi:ribosomal protein S18 acetylase RimI-like enzyme